MPYKKLSGALTILKGYILVMDTLSAMKVFCSVVENDSLAAAARLLNVSPSVVSKQLSALEDRLGVRLLK